MRAAWFVRWRDLRYRFRFWIAITGFNTLQGSFSYRVTLLYAVIYFIAWGFAMLSLLGGGAAALIQATGTADPQLVAAGLATAGMLVWIFVSAYQASRRSPLVFSSSDARLICQSPIDRRAVAFAWLLGSWPASGAPLWAAAVVLGFGAVEAALNGKVTFMDFPAYVRSGLLALSIIVPLHLGSLALVWAWGCLRLRWERQKWPLYLAPLGSAGLLAGWAAFTGSASLVERLAAPITANPLLPLALPFRAAFGVDAWITGLAVSTAWVAAGAWCLWRAARNIHLNMAAEESRHVYAAGLAFSVGDHQHTEKMRARERLASVQQPSILLEAGSEGPVTGWLLLVRKALLQNIRPLRLAKLSGWLMLTFAALGFVFGPDWGTRSWALAFWVVLLMAQGSQRLQGDLNLWKFFRQLPMPAGEVVWGELALPWAAGTLTLWLAAAAGWMLNGPLPVLPVLVLAPLVALNIILAGALDVFVQSHTDQLLAGKAPQPQVLGALLGGGVAAAAVLLTVGAIRLLPVFSRLPLAVGLCALAAYGIWRLAAHEYRKI